MNGNGSVFKEAPVVLTVFAVVAGILMLLMDDDILKIFTQRVAVIGSVVVVVIFLVFVCFEIPNIEGRKLSIEQDKLVRRLVWGGGTILVLLWVRPLTEALRNPVGTHLTFRAITLIDQKREGIGGATVMVDVMGDKTYHTDANGWVLVEDIPRRDFDQVRVTVEKEKISTEPGGRSVTKISTEPGGRSVTLPGPTEIVLKEYD